MSIHFFKPGTEGTGAWLPLRGTTGSLEGTPDSRVNQSGRPCNQSLQWFHPCNDQTSPNLEDLSQSLLVFVALFFVQSLHRHATVTTFTNRNHARH